MRKRLNGWQRIWLVLTVLAFVAAPFVYSDWVHGGIEWIHLRSALEFQSPTPEQTDELRAAARQSSLVRLGQIWLAVLAGALLLYIGSYLIYRLMLWILEGFRR